MRDVIKTTLLLGAGALVGAAAVLLFTTEKGEELREQIKEQWEKATCCKEACEAEEAKKEA